MPVEGEEVLDLDQNAFGHCMWLCQQDDPALELIIVSLNAKLFVAFKNFDELADDVSEDGYSDEHDYANDYFFIDTDGQKVSVSNGWEGGQRPIN